MLWRGVVRVFDVVVIAYITINNKGRYHHHYHHIHSDAQDNITSNVMHCNVASTLLQFTPMMSAKSSVGLSLLPEQCISRATSDHYPNVQWPLSQCPVAIAPMTKAFSGGCVLQCDSLRCKSNR